MVFNPETIAPYLGLVGRSLVNIDANTSGADDFAGQLLLYAASVIVAVDHGEDLPALPDVLQHGVADKITGVSRASLMIADSVLEYIEFQVSGKAATILRYITEAISQLLAGQTVPPPPVLP